MTIKQLTTAMLLAGMSMVSAPAVAETTVAYGYATDSELYVWGSGKAETYDIAILIDDPALVGKDITGIKVPAMTSDNITDYKVWLSTELLLDSEKKNAPDIVSVAATVDADGYINHTFDQAYAIPEGGVYVGYSFTVSSIATQADSYPAYVTAQVNPKGMYVHTSRTYRKWASKSEDLGCTSTIMAMLTGEYPDNAVRVSQTPMAYAEANEANTINVTVANYGSKTVESVGYTLNVGGKDYTGSYTFASPIQNMLGMTATMPVEFPAKGVGEYAYTLTIDQVNGQDNMIDDPQAQGTYYVFNVLPVNRPVMEEFTGTWCGWCVRGWMAMEKMNEFYPDQFIGLAYHNGDPMQIAGTSGLISAFSGGGFPSCTMNRITPGLDPYSGAGNSGFGIRDLFVSLADKFNPCAVDVTAGWTDDSHTAVNVTAEVNFVVDVPANDYRVEYVLVGNDIEGTGTGEWLQHNYYAGGSYGTPEYMEPFVTGQYKGSTCNLPFSDVVLATSGCKGVTGSLDGYEVGKAKRAFYTFEGVDDIRSNESGYTSQPIPYKEDELYVVALVLDMSKGSYGQVVNAGRAKVDGLNGIANVATDTNKTVESVSYYDLSGRQVAEPQTGIYVRSIRYTDGSVANSKVAVRK